jgi:hypothetical protein
LLVDLCSSMIYGYREVGPCSPVSQGLRNGNEAALAKLAVYVALWRRTATTG